MFLFLPNFCCCRCSPSRSSQFLKPLPPIRLRQLNVAHQEMASIVWKHALVEVLDDFHRLLCVPGTSPHAATSLSVSPGVKQANISWEAGFDGGSAQTFSVWWV